MKKDLKLDWNEWNSGGGCMIWSHDYADGKSIHVNDECMVLSSLTSEKHWEYMDTGVGEPEASDTLVIHYFEPGNYDKATFELVPYLGQELAELTVKDIMAINKNELYEDDYRKLVYEAVDWLNSKDYHCRHYVTPDLDYISGPFAVIVFLVPCNIELVHAELEANFGSNVKFEVQAHNLISVWIL